MKFIIGTVVFIAIFQKAFSLRCWRCSSDIDSSCRDPFNDYNSRSGSNSYVSQQSYQQRPYENQRQYEYNNRQYDNNNYNRQYDPNYNRQYDQNYNNGGYNGGYRNDLNSRPNYETCDDNEARNRRMKNVCLKEIVRGSNYVSVVRRCELVPYEQTIGTCSQSVSRGLTLDFCEYCDWDGCNSANGHKTNLLVGMISLIAVFLYH
uniref:Probable ATP-dependent RNA helicase ddx42 n=1 Tax=Diabrotica virgifera virgifera TaxID=50390 RepID=A0A6P7GF28_DIAVI